MAYNKAFEDKYSGSMLYATQRSEVRWFFFASESYGSERVGDGRGKGYGPAEAVHLARLI